MYFYKLCKKLKQFILLFFFFFLKKGAFKKSTLIMHTFISRHKAFKNILNIPIYFIVYLI